MTIPPRVWVVIDGAGIPCDVRHHATKPFNPEQVAASERVGLSVVPYVLPPRWIPVAERMPEPGYYLTEFDCCRGPRSCWVSEFGSDGKWRDEDGETCEPTHWMPLPDPPEVTP